MTYVYLASPYSHPNPLVREARYRIARDAVAHLLIRKIWVYSPIVHCHDLTKEYSLPFDATHWREYNEAMLREADELVVLNIPGWRESVGVAAEIAFAKSLGLFVRDFIVEGADATEGAPT